MSKAKSFLIFFIIWILALVSAFFGYKFYTQHQADKYDAVAVPYIKTIIPEVSKWNLESIKPLMAPEVLETIPDDKFSAVMAWFSKLGEFKSMAEPEFKKVYTEGETEIGKQMIVIYDVDAKYTNGDALITLKLLDRGGSYELFHFNVSSSVLVE